MFGHLDAWKANRQKLLKCRGDNTFQPRFANIYICQIRRSEEFHGCDTSSKQQCGNSTACGKLGVRLQERSYEFLPRKSVRT